MALSYVQIPRETSIFDGSGELSEELGDLFVDPRAWLNTPNSNLGGNTPQELIARGEEEVVLNLVRLIRQIGLS